MTAEARAATDIRHRTHPEAAPPFHILHVISTLHPGGTELAMLRLIGSLNPSSWRVRVAYLHGAPEIGAEIEAATGAAPCAIGLRGKADPRALWRLARMAAREHIDLVHTHMDLADYYGAAVARIHGAALVSSKQNADAFRARRTWKRPPFLLLERASYAAADAVIAVSHGLVEYLAQTERLPRHKTVVIGNGVDLDAAATAPSRSEARRRLGLPADAPVIGTVGRLADQKGQIHLVRAMVRVTEELPEVQLILAGDGPSRGRLEDEVRRLGLARSVRFLGHRDDVTTVLSALDLFVFPSLWEGLPQALLEAMAHAVPVVASRCIGVEETLVDGETGLLVAREDSPALADAAIALLRDPLRARRLGEAGRRHVAAHHSQSSVSARVERLYRNILARRR